VLRNNECGHNENAIIHGRVINNFREKKYDDDSYTFTGHRTVEGNKSKAVAHIIWNEKVN